MTTTASIYTLKIDDDLQSPDHITKSTESFQLQEHCPQSYLDQSKYSPKSKFDQIPRTKTHHDQSQEEESFSQNGRLEFFEREINNNNNNNTLQQLKYDQSQQDQIFDNRRDFNKKMRTLSVENLDWTLTSSLGTADFGQDVKFKEFIKSKRSVSISAISYKVEFLQSFRKDIWLICTGANKLIKNNSGYYKKLICDYPDFVFFRHIQLNQKFYKDKENIKSLKRVLVAYARRNPQIGYCQGFNFIAARLLKIFSQQQTFWIYASILQSYTPPNYYSDMTGLCIDAQIFSILLKQRFKVLYDKMTRLDIQITSASWQWFACIFSYNLQQQDLIKIWDLYFLQGPIMLFRISLCIIAVLEKDLLALKDPGQIQMILSRLPVTAMKKKNEFFRNLEKNPKCRYFSKERLQRMRYIIERKKFKLQEGKMKNNISHGLVFKSSTDRLLVKPKMTDFESVTNSWSTITVDKSFINQVVDDNNNRIASSNLSLSYASSQQQSSSSSSSSLSSSSSSVPYPPTPQSAQSLLSVNKNKHYIAVVDAFSPQSPLSASKIFKQKVQEFKKPGCFTFWPVCTHFSYTPMELSQFAFRVSSQSFHINQKYFYQNENDLSCRLQQTRVQIRSSSLSKKQGSTKRDNPSNLQQQQQQQQQFQPKNQTKSLKQQQVTKRAFHIKLKPVDLPKEEDFLGRQYQNLLILRQPHQCYCC